MGMQWNISIKDTLGAILIQLLCPKDLCREVVLFSEV